MKRQIKNFLLNVAVRAEALLLTGGAFLIMVILGRSLFRIENDFLTIRIGPNGWIALFGVVVLVIIVAIRLWAEKETRE